MIVVGPRQNASEYLLAGRRAAYTATLIEGRKRANTVFTGETDEQYAGGVIAINGFDIGPAIDAAVLETIVRIMSIRLTPTDTRS